MKYLWPFIFGCWVALLYCDLQLKLRLDDLSPRVEVLEHIMVTSEARAEQCAS